MSNVVILRTVYALDSNTGLFLSSGQLLTTDGRGGTFWLPTLSSLMMADPSTIGYLPSTISTLSSVGYSNDVAIQNLSSSIYPELSSLSATVAEIVINSTGVLSSVFYSTIDNLGSPPYNYISSSTLDYVVSSYYQSTINNLSTYGYVTAPQLTSTVTGLGTVNYVSSTQLQSTVDGLGTAGYVSTGYLNTWAYGLSSIPFGYVNATWLTSTVNGLGTAGYVSTAQLSTLSNALSTQKANIYFDNTGNVTTIGSINNFCNFNGQVIFTSTIFNSTTTFTAASPLATNFGATTINQSSLLFSSININISSHSNYINPSTIVTLDIYPFFLFDSLGDAAQNAPPPVLSMSTYLTYGDVPLLSTNMTSFFYPQNYKVLSPSPPGSFCNASNAYQTPIRITLPRSTINNYTSNYTLYHYLPNSISYANSNPGFHSASTTQFFGPTNNVFISIQNVP